MIKWQTEIDSDFHYFGFSPKIRPSAITKLKKMETWESNGSIFAAKSRPVFPSHQTQFDSSGLLICSSILIAESFTVNIEAKYEILDIRSCQIKFPFIFHVISNVLVTFFSFLMISIDIRNSRKGIRIIEIEVKTKIMVDGTIESVRIRNRLAKRV